MANFGKLKALLRKAVVLGTAAAALLVVSLFMVLRNPRVHKDHWLDQWAKQATPDVESGEGPSQVKGKDMPSGAQAPQDSPSPSVETPERVSVSLPTGTWLIRPRGVAGDGVLRIQNGSFLDAAVKLVTSASPRRTIWMLYVRAGDRKSVKGIAEGTYLLRFSLGRDWDADARPHPRFLSEAEYYQAGKQLDFIETPPASDEGRQYTLIEVTLNPVFAGNLVRQPIDESTFDEGDKPK